MFFQKSISKFKISSIRLNHFNASFLLLEESNKFVKQVKYLERVFVLSQRILKISFAKASGYIPLIGGGDGTAGIAASSSAGAAVATPVLIAEMVPAFKPMAPAATSLVATAVIVTSILVPILTSIWSRKVKARAAKIEILGTVK